MRRTEVLQGLRRMKFEDVYGRWQQRQLSQAEAAEILGMRERAFRRWRDRYDEDGSDGLDDRRLGRAAAKRVPVDEVERVLALYRTRYAGFTVKQFHEELVRDHGFRLGSSWTKLTLPAAGRVPRAPRRAAHRKKRPRRPLPGMLLHQDGSTHHRLPALERPLDLIATALGGPVAMHQGRATNARPDRHPRRRHQRDLLGLAGRAGGHHEPLSGLGGGKSPRTACSAPSTAIGPRTTSTRPRPAARSTGTG